MTPADSSASPPTQPVLRLAFGVGQVILENGGETYRAEETIDRIAAAYGLSGTESFVVPTGIMATVTAKGGETSTLTRRIMRRTLNLEKVARASALARSLESNPRDPESAFAELHALASLRALPLPLLHLCSGLVAACFTLFFGGGFREFSVALAAGAAIRAMLTLSDKAGFGEFFGNALGGAVAALIALFAARAGFAPGHDAVIIGSIMLLVPGILIVNAIRDTLSGEILSGTSRAVEALVLAMGVALGTGGMLRLWLFLAGAP